MAGRRTLTIALAWLPPCVYTGLIWWLSSQAITSALIQDIPMQDKGLHLVEYGVLGFLLAHASSVSWPDRKLRLVVAAWLSLGLALIDEIHQAFVPGRSGDGLDLLADAIGISGAVLLYALLRRLALRRRVRESVSPP